MEGPTCTSIFDLLQSAYLTDYDVIYFRDKFIAPELNDATDCTQNEVRKPLSYYNLNICHTEKYIKQNFQILMRVFCVTNSVHLF
jgi:hypothetical protein